MNTPDPVVAVRDIAALLGVTENAVTKWLRSGELRGRKHGGAWYVRQSAVDAFLDPDQDTHDVA